MQGDHISQAKLKMVPKASKTKQKKSNFIKTRKFLSVPGATEGVKEEQTFRKADRKIWAQVGGTHSDGMAPAEFTTEHTGGRVQLVLCHLGRGSLN